MPAIYKNIYCCQCETDVNARLTDGGEIYPHRPDLKSLPFWKCDSCKNTVGCHHKTKNRTKPLGVIPSPEIKTARKHIHALIDPVWQSGRVNRRDLYKSISDAIGWEYHTAEIRTVIQAREVYAAALKIIGGKNQ